MGSETVAVIRLPADGPPYIEGLAVVDRPAREGHRYWVQLIGDPAPRRRLLRPEFQDDPDLMIVALRDLWRASQALSDFFPDRDV